MGVIMGYSNPMYNSQKNMGAHHTQERIRHRKIHIWYYLGGGPALVIF